MNSKHSQLIAGSLLLHFCCGSLLIFIANTPVANTSGPAAASKPAGQRGLRQRLFSNFFRQQLVLLQPRKWLGDYTFTRTVADVSDSGFTMNDLTSLAAGTVRQSNGTVRRQPGGVGFRSRQPERVKLQCEDNQHFGNCRRL